MKMGDFVVAVNHQDVKWSKHEDVVKLIRESSSHLCLTLITVTDRNFLDPNPPPPPPGPPPAASMQSPVSSSPTVGDGDDVKHGELLKTKSKTGLTWTLRRKLSSSREKYETSPTNGHITLNGTLK